MTAMDLGEKIASSPSADIPPPSSGAVMNLAGGLSCEELSRMVTTSFA